MKLFYNARFYSMRKEGEFYKALLIDEGKIIDVFNELPDIKNAEMINLNSLFVFPGFIDTHTHCFEGGLYCLGADLLPARNLKDVFEIIAGTKPLAGKIFASHFDENSIAEKRFPTKEELDRIFPKTPVLMRRIDGHSCVINSKAAENINWKYPLSDNFNGHLNHKLNGNATNWFHKDLDKETIIQAYHKAAEIGLLRGHTSIHTMVGDAESDLRHFRLIKKHLDHFVLDFILYPQVTNIGKVMEIGSHRIGGCILADGSFGSYTAALTEPYSDDPDNFGALYRSDKFWRSFIHEAHSLDLQVAVHCIGNAAIKQISGIYSEIQNEFPKDLRHEIIHNELTTDEMLDEMKEANVSAVMQPMFDRLWAGENGLYESRLGKERTSRTNRLASITQRGILLTGGSDWYITDMNALKGIDAAVKMYNEKERLSPYQAVELYTSNAARLSFDEDRIGKIAKGMQADLVCLEEDIFQSSEIGNIKIKSVVKEGNLISTEK